MGSFNEACIQPLPPVPGVVCPFDGAQLENWHDCNGYTQFICPECDCRFRADAWASHA